MIDGGFNFSGVAAQAAGIVLALGAMAFSPTAVSTLILVPIGYEARVAVLTEALAGGARLTAQGPLSASLVVYGDRSDLVRATRRSRVLIVAAPFAGCSAGVA